MNPLFPIRPDLILFGFTTSLQAASVLPQLILAPLTDSALGVHKVTSQTTHNVVKVPSSSNSANPLEAWEAFYPSGSINPGNIEAPRGGFGFYLRGPHAFSERIRQERPSEIIMSYAVMFEEGWRWQKGGKLPGLYGGVGDSAYGCTGGRQTDRCKCFNLRLMWREHGSGELYAYLPQNSTNTQRMLEVPPQSVQHPDYGFSAGMGSWYFPPGRWTVVAERIKMNETGKEDGEIEVYIDGRSVIRAHGLVLRDSTAPDSYVQGMHFQTFFGGHSTEWACPKPQRAYFAHVSGAILHSPPLVLPNREEL